MHKQFALCALLALAAACGHNDAGGRNGALMAIASDGAGADRFAALVTDRKADLPLPKKKWTVMVHMCGDNNLSPYMAADIKEMIAAGAGDACNVVILRDNDPSQDGGEKKKYNGYYSVGKDGVTLLKDTGEVNMGNPAVAKDFIDFAVANFPAERWCWIFWNHGGGVDRSSRGVSWDDTNGGDHLTEAEQKEILEHFKKKSGGKLDVLGYDACLMAAFELAYEFRNLASYLVASEETIPGEGWDYRFIEKIVKTPSITPKTLAKNIVDYYGRYYKKAEDDSVTLSAVSLSKVAKLASALDAFAAVAIEGGDPALYRKIARSLDMFGYYVTDDGATYCGRDLYAFLSAAAQSAPEAVRAKAAAAVAAMENGTVPYETHGSSWDGAAHGLTIITKKPTEIYRKLEICRRGHWDEFCQWAAFPEKDRQ